MPFAQGRLTQALGRELTRMTGVRLDDAAWDDIELDEHLLMRIRVLDAEGRELASGRDYGALCSQLMGELSEQRSAAVPAVMDSQRPSVEAGQAPLALKISQRQAGIDVDFWPAWVEQGDRVVEQLFDNPLQAEQAHRLGVQRLLLQAMPEQARFLRQKLPAVKEAALYYRELGNQQQLTEDILLAAIDRVCLPEGSELPRTPEQLQALAQQGRAELVPAAEQLAAQVLAILKNWHGLQKRFKGRIDLAHAIAMNDVRSQLDQLIFKGFVRQVPQQWLAQYPRYLAAITQRLDKLPGQVQRDRVWTDELQRFWQQYQSLQQRYQVEGRADERLHQWRWMLEEYRVSLFAQQLGTRMPVSDKRLNKLWQEITA
jgi:ATP-dependent helicase HrpA